MSRMISIRIPDELAAHLEVAAETLGSTVSALARQWLSERLAGWVLQLTPEQVERLEALVGEGE